MAADDDIRARLIEADEKLFREILEDHGPHVMGWLKARGIECEFDREEILAGSIVRMIEKSQSFDPERGNLRQYFFLQARNELSAFCNSRSVESLTCDIESLAVINVRALDQPFPAADASRIDAAVSRLDHRDQEILNHFVFRDGSLSWTAPLLSKLKMTAKAIRRRIPLIRKRMIMELAALGVEDEVQ